MATLTDGRSGTIAKAQPPASGQRFVFDEHRDAPRGFGLRLTAAGGKAFVLTYSMNGRRRRKTIGDWPTWTLEAARQEARELMLKIVAGDDPLEADRKRREEPLVEGIAKDWLEMHASGLKSEKAIRGFVHNDIIPAIGRLKVSDVRRRDVIELVERKAVTAPRSAAQILIYARRLFDYATDRDYIPANPLAGLKPSSIKVRGKRDPLKSVARARILDGDEIRGFWLNAESCGLHRLTALALKFVLVTGQRPGEVAGLASEEISGRTWTIPQVRRGKTQSDHRVYLTDTACEILDAAKEELSRLQKRRKRSWDGYYFEASPGAPVTTAGLCRAVSRHHTDFATKHVAPWGRWTPHDLRRTMRTGLSACKVRPDIAELAIGHVKTGIVAVYDQYAFEEECAEALTRWEARLLDTVWDRPPAQRDNNIIQLREGNQHA
ncbi:tyrosine-type recombinase/integrase [Albibacillus kandeliae]|uniref:tyrosine-type recombinase/integrase n=1 Tax=Albibacillus kandeliae TaxID=2174228 RepID=UPI000D69E2FC|nr:site-specific integrase [Albibacillus kandeliae]